MAFPTPSLLQDRPGVQSMNTIGTPGTGITVQECGSGAVRQTVLTFNSAELTITDDGTSGHGSLAIYTLPTGVVNFLGVTGKLTYAYGAATDANMLSSIGTTAANTDSDLSDTGEGNLVASTATAIASSAGSFTAKSTAAAVVDGASSANVVRLNMATSSDPSGDKTVTITGKLVITWANLGDATGA